MLHMKHFSRYNRKSVKWWSYHDDKILIECNIWKSYCMENFAVIEIYVLHSDFLCCMENFVKFHCSRQIFVHIKFYMFHVKTCKSVKQLTKTGKNFYASSTRAGKAEKFHRKNWKTIDFKQWIYKLEGFIFRIDSQRHFLQQKDRILEQGLVFFR